MVEEVSSGNNNIDMEMTSDQDVCLVRDSTHITTPSATMNVQSLIEQTRAQDPGHTYSIIPLGGNDNKMTLILGALTSVTQCFTNVDIISPNLQKDILEGKDINLATLLIPFYDCPTKYSVVPNGIEVNVTGKSDIRLNRWLSIQ